MERLLVYVAVLVLVPGLTAAADDYATVRSIPFPRTNAGANTAISYMQGTVVFLTQQAGAEDVYFIDPLTGVVATHWTAPSPFYVISGLGDDGTLLYAVSSTTNRDKIAVIDMQGTVVSIYPAINKSVAHYGSATDGMDLFVSTTGKRVYRINKTTGALINSFTVGTAPNTFFGLAHDTTKLIGVVMDTSGPSTVMGVDDTTGAELFRFNGPGISGNSRGLGYGDQGNLYVGNQGDNRIYVMAPVPEPLSTIAVGQSTRIRLAAPIARLEPYVLGAAFTNATGIPLIDGRVIPLDLDSLLVLTFQLPGPMIFQDFQGVLDASGVGQATLHVPAAPALKGLKFKLAFVTMNPMFPVGIRVISAARDVMIQ